MGPDLHSHCKTEEVGDVMAQEDGTLALGQAAVFSQGQLQSHAWDYQPCAVIC